MRCLAYHYIILGHLQWRGNQLVDWVLQTQIVQEQRSHQNSKVDQCPKNWRQSHQNCSQNCSMLDQWKGVECKKSTIMVDTETYSLGSHFQEQQHWTDDLDPLPMEDPYSYKIVFPVMDKLAKKIELATQMYARRRHSSTDFQVKRQ